MSPLRIEVFRHPNEWLTVGELHPTDQPGSVSQNKPNGEREIFSFHCSENGRESLILRSTAGIDTVIGGQRYITTQGWEVVARLQDGEQYSVSVKMDAGSQRHIVRFTHVDEA